MSKKSKALEYYYEKFKAALLVFLIVLCIVQIGILWSSQSGSFPFLSSFFPDSKATSQVSLEEMKENYMLPYKVVLSKGYDEEHYIVPNGSREYKSLWDNAGEYITKALETKPTQTQPIDEEKWGVILANKSYYFEFKTQISIDIVKWVLNIKKPVDTLSGLSKIVICPDDPNNSYYDVIYIRDAVNIYTYILTDHGQKSLDQEVFDSVYNSLHGKPNVSNYKIAIETGITSALPKDMIAPFTSNSTESYATVEYTPLGSQDGHTSSLAEYNAVQMELFGEVRSDYMPDEDVYGSIVFKNSDSVYRLYSNSVAEYKFIGTQISTEKPKVLEAYQRAVSFIMDIKDRSKYMGAINLYLSSISESSNSYTFKFDYSISQAGEHGELPVLLKDFTLPGSDQPFDSAITIETTSKRVIQCRWLALKLQAEKSLIEYKWNFPEFVDKAYNSIDSLKNSNLPIQNYGIYYVLVQGSKDYSINPSFVLFNSEGNYSIPLNGQ